MPYCYLIGFITGVGACVVCTAGVLFTTVAREHFREAREAREMRSRREIWEHELPVSKWDDGLTNADMSLPKTWRA